MFQILREKSKMASLNRIEILVGTYWILSKVIMNNTNHSTDYIKNIDPKSFPEIFDLEITAVLVTNSREIVFSSNKNNIRFSLHKPLSYTLEDFPCFSSDIYKSSNECCEIQILKEG